jgi:hypothetical protein
MVSTTDQLNLSVVVPVGKLHGDISALETWIPNSGNSQVILVLDQTDSKTLSAIKNSTVLSTQSNLELHHVDFGNPGETRNFGYEKCLGEWVFFSDSDDEPAIRNILTSVENVNDEAIGVIVGNYEVYRSEQNSIDKIESQNLTVLLNSLPGGLGLWRFIFRKHYLDGKKIEFPPLSMAEDQVFFLKLNAEQSEIKFEDKIFYRYFIGRPFQLTKDKLKIQELKKSIQMTVKILEKDSKTNRFDFLSAQYFSLVLNCSTKHLIGNLLFLLKISQTIINRLGYKKMFLLISYPVRRIL